MNPDLKVIDGKKGEEKSKSEHLSPKEQLRIFKVMTSSMMREALGVWTEIYGEFEGTVTYGTIVRPEAEKGFTPKCGWPEFLEKMWILEHYLDHLNRICEGKA